MATAFSPMLLALALQAAPAPPPNPEVQRDIVVIGAKLKNFTTRVYSKDGKMFCQTKRSTGDKEIDAIGCTAAATCMTELRPRIIASVDRKLPRAERKRLNDLAGRDFYACTMARRDALIADLAERRWQARQGTPNASN